MGRPKRYASEAEKQAAYRERKKVLGLGKPESEADTRDNLGKDEANLTAVPVLAEPKDTSGFEPAISSSRQARESTTECSLETVTDTKDSRCGSQPFGVEKEVKSDLIPKGIRDVVPREIPEREWKYAVERAERARRYAAMFSVSKSEIRFSMPLWQWENEVRGRFGGIIGGSLSGTRG